MPQELVVTIAVLSAVTNSIGTVPYIIDTLKGKTKPERAMWWVYVALFGVLFAAQADAGAGWLLLVTGAYVLATVVIASLSVKYGYGRFHWRDGISLLIAAVGLVLWKIFDEPLLTIVLVIIVDFAGFWLTIVKTWHAPHTETLISWQLSGVSAVLSLAAAGSWSLSVLAYPAYSVFGTLLLVGIIIMRRRQVAADPQDF
jgi:hypothetical protein